MEFPYVREPLPLFWTEKTYKLSAGARVKGAEESDQDCETKRKEAELLVAKENALERRSDDNCNDDLADDGVQVDVLNSFPKNTLPLQAKNEILKKQTAVESLKMPTHIPNLKEVCNHLYKFRTQGNSSGKIVKLEYFRIKLFVDLDLVFPDFRYHLERKNITENKKKRRKKCNGYH